MTTWREAALEYQKVAKIQADAIRLLRKRWMDALVSLIVLRVCFALIVLFALNGVLAVLAASAGFVSAYFTARDWWILKKTPYTSLDEDE